MVPTAGSVREDKAWGWFSHTLFTKYYESFFISFVSLPLIKNLAEMLCKGKPYRHFI